MNNSTKSQIAALINSKSFKQAFSLLKTTKDNSLLNDLAVLESAYWRA